MHMHKWYAYAYARAYAGCTLPVRANAKRLLCWAYDF